VQDVAPGCAIDADEEALLRSLLAIDPRERPASALQIIERIEALACCAPSPVADGPTCRAPRHAAADNLTTETITVAKSRLRIL
jgi:hypothetical protein